MTRWRFRIGLGLAVTAALVAIGAGWCVYASLPPSDATLRVAGLDGSVEVLIDDHGVPHIFADSYPDAVFALGYVHGRDRLWQMETMRRFGAGRLSEVFGERTLQSDRYMRTLGLYRLAEQELDGLSAEWRRILDAYAAGVNAWLATGPVLPPPEFLVLRHAPEPWRPADTLAWGRIMAWRLTQNRGAELLRARLAERLRPDQIDELWPGDGAAAPITGTAGIPLFVDPERPDRPQGASNVWVVGGARTVSGKPLLASDPHLALTVPGPWYLARLVTSDTTMAGATAPGTPLVFLGHNDRIAWGYTSGDGDLEDVFIERLDPANPHRYLGPDGPLPFITRDEVIEVKGGPPVAITVRSTRHGPVISDALPAGGATAPGVPADGAHVLALSAPYLRAGDRTSEAQFRAPLARNWEGFRDALRAFESTQINAFAAGTDGTIGFVAAGRVPVRRSGDGRVPAPGWTGDADWIGAIPYDDLPEAVDPPAGLLVNANNRNVPLDHPGYFGSAWDPGYRARRILDLLQSRPVHTLDTMAAIQMDTVSLAARDLLPLLLRTLPPDHGHNDIVAMLRSWDGDMRRDRPEPLIFTAWLRALGEALYADELGDAFELYWDIRSRFIKYALSDGRRWCDDIRTTADETCAARVGAALNAAHASLNDLHGPDAQAWRWGDAHRVVLRHPLFDRIPVVGRLARIEIETDGGSHTINRGAYALADPDAPYQHVHGAGYRAIYDLSDLSRSRFVAMPGQSGHPLSPHYDDLLRMWRSGGWITLGRTRETLRDAASGRLVLEPGAPTR